MARAGTSSRRFVMLVEASTEMVLRSRGVTRWERSVNAVHSFASSLKDISLELYFCNSKVGAVKMSTSGSEEELKERFANFPLEGQCRLSDVPAAACREPAFDAESYLALLSTPPVDAEALRQSVVGLRFGKKEFTLSFYQIGHVSGTTAFVDGLRQEWPGVVDAKTGRA
jgi:hypothetical protein